jgi:hypothetical protein
MPPRKRAATKPAVDLANAKHNILPDLLDSAAIVPLDGLTRYHKNFRKGDQAEIRKSLRVNGQYRAVCVNRGTHTGRANEILAGNNTVQAARAEEWDVIAVGWVDVDEQAAAKIVAVDNLLNDKATNDEDALKELMSDLDDLEGSGMTDDEFAKLLGAGDGGDDPDTSPQLPDAEYAVIINCRDEEQQAELLETFEAEGLDARPLMM